MAKCRAKTSAGEPCKMSPLKGSNYCFTHAPEVGAARAMARKRGGQRRRVEHAGDPFTLPETFVTVQDANKLLDYTLAEVLPMENSIARARILLAIHESYLRSIEIGELEQRIKALEERTK